jgi:outer membrane protein TolC
MVKPPDLWAPAHEAAHRALSKDPSANEFKFAKAEAIGTSASSARMTTENRPVGVRCNALLNLEWPIYDGGELQNKLKLAQSKRDQAAEDLRGQFDQALREVRRR